jgi:multidrug efflux system membrane fusion protein
MRPRAAPTPRASPAVPVVVGTAAVRDLPIWITAVGTVQSLNVVAVRSRVEGELQKVDFVEGQEVKAGQRLAQIDPRPFQAQLDQADANLRRDEATLVHARAERERYVDLAAKGFVAATQVEALRATELSTEATVAADRAAIETARLQLGFATIAAPVDGRVGLRQVDPGSMVRTTDANPIVTIAQVRPISVVFAISQDAIPDVLAEQSRRKLAVVVEARDGARRLAEGDLATLDNQVDTATAQIRAKALFPNTSGTLFPGELVSVRLLLRTAQSATAVPAQAVLTGLQGTYVYVAKSDVVEPRPVKVGTTVDGFTEVRSGLAPGDVVVVEGQSRLAPGARIERRTSVAEGKS